VYLGQNTGDSVVFTGDGVDDLDRLLSILANGTQRDGKVMCDVAAGNYSDYRRCDMDDIVAIRGYFIGWYGTVSKINVYAEGPSVAYPQQTIEVSL
jgi:hypothetical protein